MTAPFGQPRPVRAPAGSEAFLAILAAAVPPLPGHDHARPMCAAWLDHERRRPAQAPDFCCMKSFETMGRAHRTGCPTGVPRDSA